MPYKDKAKHREYYKEYMRKRRGYNKGITKEGITYSKGSTSIPDVIPIDVKSKPRTFRPFSKAAQVGKV